VIKVSEEYERLIHINTSFICDNINNIIPSYDKNKDIDYTDSKNFHLNLLTLWDCSHISVHICSSLSPPVYPINMDIINAFCYS